MKECDALIIGLGPAGATAAGYISAAGFKTVLIGKKGGALYKAERIANFYGLKEITGKELFLRGLKRAEELGASVLFGEAFDIAVVENGFEVRTSEDVILAKAVLIATGAARNKPSVINLKKYEGRGVSYCAVCDGFFYRKKNVGVLGSGAYAANEAEYLSGLGCGVTVFSDGEVKELYGDDVLEGVILGDGRKIPLDALFIAIGSATSVDFARKIGLETANGFIKVTPKCETNCKGVYAAGDCTGGFLQVAKAVGEGAVAGNEIFKYLKSVAKRK